MKAIVLTAYGDVDRLELRDVPEPTPGPNEVKIRMVGAGINPIDWKIRSGAVQAFMPMELPTILGREASGTVVAVGSGVTTFAVGARVLGFVNQGYAELVVAPVESWAAVPAKLDLVDAAALPVALLTGAQLIDEAVQAGPGDHVLVIGATGSVGRVAVFVAKSRGAKVHAGVRGKHQAAAEGMGVDSVVVLDGPRALDELPQLDAIADTVGGDTTQKLLGKVKAGGTIGSTVGEPAGAKERGLIVRAMRSHPEPRRLAELAEAVAAGRLVIPIARRFPLSQAGEAQKVAERGADGKVVLVG